MSALALVQAQVQAQVPVVGGASASVFPLVEAWFSGGDDAGDRHNALRRIAGRRNIGRYRSVIDFVLCETTPSYRPACFAFYLSEDAGALRAVAGPAELRALEARLVLFLTIAYEAFVQDRRMSWRRAVEWVEYLSAA